MSWLRRINFVRPLSPMQSTKRSSVKAKNLNDGLKSVPVTFMVGPDLSRKFETTSIYLDTHGEEKAASARGTVVAMHGVPGSHNDFKYMKPLLEEANIRLIGLNFPGYGFVKGDLKVMATNAERNSYIRSVVEALELDKVKNLILLGHSRAGDNALQVADELTDKGWPITAAFLVNSTGFRPHRGIQPRYRTIKLFTWLVQRQNAAINLFTYPILKFFYNNIVKLRVPSAEVAAFSLPPLLTFAFESQRKVVNSVCQKPNLRVLYAFSGDDFLIEECISWEFAKSFNDQISFATTNCKEEVEETTKKVEAEFLKGTKHISVCFKDEGHFLQKHHAQFLVRAISSVIESQPKQ